MMTDFLRDQEIEEKLKDVQLHHSSGFCGGKIWHCNKISKNKMPKAKNLEKLPVICDKRRKTRSQNPAKKMRCATT
jgi:hypothetical protein